MKDSIQKYLERELNHELAGLDLSKISEEIKDEIFAVKKDILDNYPPMPLVKPPKKNNIEKSKDNEIKMQMAKDLFIAHMHHYENGTDREVVDIDIHRSCEIAEQIFNRFNK